MGWLQRRRQRQIDDLSDQLVLEEALKLHYRELLQDAHERIGREVRARQSAEQMARRLRRHVESEQTIAQAWSALKDKRFEMESSLVGAGWFFEERRIKAFEETLRGVLGQ